MEQNLRNLYLDLMIKCLTNTIYEDASCHPWQNSHNYIHYNRINGCDWPMVGHTMIGVKRLENLRELAEKVIHDKIPGDFIEAGVWRGGATIFMRAILKAHNISDRNVWVADSFEGLPKPIPEIYPHDKSDNLYTFKELKVSLEEVQNNFRKYDLLDGQVKFLKGFFCDTMPTAPVDKISLLRLDGDMYQSTIECLENLYPKLSVGGFVILDDANMVMGCRHAIIDYRKKYNITQTMYRTPDFNGLGAGVYWRK